MKQVNHKLQKQTVLKSLLLFALLANVSWKPALRSLDLASSKEAMSATPQAPSDIQISKPNPPPIAVTTNDATLKPDAPLKAVSAPVEEKPTRTETPKICGERFYVTYREVVNRSEVFTEIQVKAHTTGDSKFRVINLRSVGGFDVNLDKKDIKRETDKKIEKMIRDRALSCAKRDRDTDHADRRDKEEIKNGLKACRVNSKGDALTEIERTRCRLHQLSEIEVDDRRGSQTKAFRQLEKLVRGDIRRSIKNRLMSKDESKVEEGEELLTEVIEQIHDLAVDMNLEPYRASKLIMEIKSLRAGGETYRRSALMSEEVKLAKEELREELRQATADYHANPRDLMAAGRLKNVRNEMLRREQQFRHQMQSEISRGPYASLLAAQREGQVSSSEFSQFVLPYQALNRDILSLIDQRSVLSDGGYPHDSSLGALSGISMELPSDFLSYRRGLSNSFQKDYGVTLPQRPVNANITYDIPNGRVFNSLSGPPLPLSGARPGF